MVIKTQQPLEPLLILLQTDMVSLMEYGKDTYTFFFIWYHLFALILAGFLFIDYIANVMAMDQKWPTPPVYQRQMHLSGM